MSNLCDHRIKAEVRFMELLLQSSYHYEQALRLLNNDKGQSALTDI